MKRKQLITQPIAEITPDVKLLKPILSSQLHHSNKMLSNQKTQWSDGHALHARTATATLESFASDAKKKELKLIKTSLKVRENKKLKTTEDLRESHKRTELLLGSMLMERKLLSSLTTTMLLITDTRKDKYRTGPAKAAPASTTVTRTLARSAS
jgi:hypothetical protein